MCPLHLFSCAISLLIAAATHSCAAPRYGRRLAYSGNAHTSGRLRTALSMRIAQRVVEVRIKGRFSPFRNHDFSLGVTMRVKSLAAALGIALIGIGSFGVAYAAPEQVGEVSTAFRWLGHNDRVVVEAYDDPKVQGVTCYVSRARTGGVKGTIGLAEDRAEASIACRQVATSVRFPGKLPLQEDVFTERMSILFKRLHIVRVVDPRRNTLIYLTYSDKLIDGSPQNSVTAVPVPATTPIPVK